MPWVMTGPVDWTNQDHPGYVIVQVGDGYEVHREGKRIRGKWASGRTPWSWSRTTSPDLDGPSRLGNSR